MLLQNAGGGGVDRVESFNRVIKSYTRVKTTQNANMLFWTLSGHASTLPFQIAFKSSFAFLCSVTPRSLSCCLPQALDLGNVLCSGPGSLGLTTIAGRSLPPARVVRGGRSRSDMANKKRTARIGGVLLRQQRTRRGGGRGGTRGLAVLRGRVRGRCGLLRGGGHRQLAGGLLGRCRAGGRCGPLSHRPLPISGRVAILSGPVRTAFLTRCAAHSPSGPSLPVPSAASLSPSLPPHCLLQPRPLAHTAAPGAFPFFPSFPSHPSSASLS